MLAPIEDEPNALWPAHAWAARIRQRWCDGVASIIECGKLLTAAKEALPHGEFGKMIESDLPFGPSTAQRLMAIGADRRITNPAHVQHLPPHWGTLYELTKLTDDEFEKAVEAKAIHPELERKALINGARSLMGSRVEPAESADYFPTPPWATRALLEHVLPLVDDKIAQRAAWEPACGEGHIAEVLKEYFRSVTATDLHQYGYGAAGQDFTDPETDFHGDWIITNPPFGKLTEQFADRALQLAKVGVALFVRLQWLEGEGRYERIYEDRAPTVIAFFAERVNLCKGLWDPKGGTATAYIWLVWVKGEKPRAPVWIPPGRRAELTRADDVERFTTHPVTRRS
jgi:hypothetical protein